MYILYNTWTVCRSKRAKSTLGGNRTHDLLRVKETSSPLDHESLSFAFCYQLWPFLVLKIFNKVYHKSEIVLSLHTIKFRKKFNLRQSKLRYCCTRSTTTAEQNYELISLLFNALCIYLLYLVFNQLSLIIHHKSLITFI